MQKVVAVLMLVLASVGAGGCSKTSGEDSSREPDSSAATPSQNDDDDATTPAPTPDNTHCRDSLNTAVSACGAQFLDSAGQAITQNELLSACGQEKVECVVDCWDDHGECEGFRDCLGAGCGLQ